MTMVERVELDDVAITALPIGSMVASFDLIDGMAPERAVAILDGLGCATDARVHGHAFAVETADEMVMIDVGMGAAPPFDGLPSSLVDAGIAAHRVSGVVITHLHPDHANGLLDDTFSHATVYVPAAEVAFARNPAAIAAAGPLVASDYACAGDVLDAIGTRLVEIPQAPNNTPLPAGLVAVPLPGHSPGHTGYRLRAGGSTVLFVGDLLHLPELQGRYPEVSVRSDVDPRLAATTRRDVLDDAARTNTLLAGAHLGTQGFRRVTADDGSTRLM